MKQSFLLFILIIVYVASDAQQVVPASGGNATGITGTVSYSVGQLVYQPIVGGGGRVAQGIQQPAPFFVPLEIALRSFEVQCHNGRMHLAWRTGHTGGETIFEIEKSNNGVGWEVCHRMRANENALPTDYSWVDTSPFETETYYRLKLVDAGGTFYFSNTVVVINCDAITNVISVFPNPATDGFIVHLNDYEMSHYTMSTAEGKFIQKGNLSLANHFVAIQQLPISNYIISIYQKNQFIKSFIISKK